MKIRKAVFVFLTLDLILIGLLCFIEQINDRMVISYDITNKKVALTFDDGSHPQYTELLLDGLKERKVEATFFITGQNAEKYPDIVLRIQKEGHMIGNHTYSHMKLTKNNEETFKQELIKTNTIITNITGEDVMFVRPPYGCWNKTFEKELNMLPVLWNVDPLDWCSSNSSKITNLVLSKIKKNSHKGQKMEQDWIILLHDQYESSVKAALNIVDELQKEGYQFVTVEEILFD